MRGMGLCHPPARLKGRQHLPVYLVMIAISVAMMCSLAQAQCTFISQPHTVGDTASISLFSAKKSLSSTARFMGGTSVCGHVPLGTSCSEATASSWSFQNRCMLLLCAATAGIALSPKRRHGWQSAKARQAKAKRCVAGFGAKALPGRIALPVLHTHGSMSPAAMSPASQADRKSTRLNSSH